MFVVVVGASARWSSVVGEAVNVSYQMSVRSGCTRSARFRCQRAGPCLIGRSTRNDLTFAAHV